MSFASCQSLTFCWGADGIFVFSPLCKCLGETLSDILEKKKEKSLFQMLQTHSRNHLVSCLFSWYFLHGLCMQTSCYQSIFVVYINTRVDKQVSVFLTITQTLMVFMLRDMQLVTCASEPVIANSTHLLTALQSLPSPGCVLNQHKMW